MNTDPTAPTVVARVSPVPTVDPEPQCAVRLSDVIAYARSHGHEPYLETDGTIVLISKDNLR